MSQSKVISEFAEELQASIEKDEFVKLSLQKRKNKGQDLQSIDVKALEGKENSQLQFIYHYKAKDTTETLGVEESVRMVTTILGANFLECSLYTNKRDVLVKFNKKQVPKMQSFKPTYPDDSQGESRAETKPEIDTKDNVYLTSLGIVDQREEIIKNMKDYYNAMNDFVGIFHELLQHISLEDEIRILDISKGQGHFAFAIYDYILNFLDKQANYTVYEEDANLVKYYNNIAEKANFMRLNYVQGGAANADFSDKHIVLAMFSADEDTDVMIHRALKGGASLVLTAPYKDSNLTKQLEGNVKVGEFYKFDILRNKQANVLSNGIRSLLLEAQGFKTDIREFLNPDFPQNDLLLSAYRNNSTDKKDVAEQLERIKSYFSIKQHYLEKLLNE